MWDGLWRVSSEQRTDPFPVTYLQDLNTPSGVGRIGLEG